MYIDIFVYLTNIAHSWLVNHGAYLSQVFEETMAVHGRTRWFAQMSSAIWAAHLYGAGFRFSGSAGTDEPFTWRKWG